MNYRDIIREMELSGRHSEAEELRSSMEDHHISEYDRVHSRNDARDGLDFGSYAASMAERAFDDIRHAERREEERREEEARLRDIDHRRAELEEEV